MLRHFSAEASRVLHHCILPVHARSFAAEAAQDDACLDSFGNCRAQVLGCERTQGPSTAPIDSQANQPAPLRMTFREIMIDE